MEKRCGTCGETKPVSEFHRRGAIYQSVCRACRRAYDAAYHRRTRARRLEQKRRYHAELLEWHRALKDTPCVDCGGRFHHAAMAWDHRAFDGAYAAAFLNRMREILETHDWEAELA